MEDNEELKGNNIENKDYDVFMELASDSPVAGANNLPEKSIKVQETPKKERLLRKQDIILIVALLLFFVAFVITGSIIKLSQINGDSMYPTLDDGDAVLVNRIVSKVEHGDIIVFRRKDNESDKKGKLIIKRVIGCPGDRVEILEGGIVKLNGEILQEEYLQYPEIKDANTWDIVLKDDEYFVLGDNREVSYDSEDYGPINKDQIHAKLICRLGSLVIKR